MVSTRNAPPSASLASPKTTRGRKKFAARPGRERLRYMRELTRSYRAGSAVDPTSTAASQSKSSPANGAQAVGSRLRKRGRNESHANDETSLSSNLPIGEQNPHAKRAKTQTSPEETTRRTRGRALPASQIVPQATIPATQDTMLGSAQLNFESNTPNMMGYDETLNDQFGLHGYSEMAMNDSASLSLQGLQLRTQSLPVLDNFATQILSVTATSSYQDIFNMATSPQTLSGQQWSQLLTLFSETKKVYTSGDPFLSRQGLGFIEKGHIDTIKKANMATFICGLFGGREDVGFSHLNEFFLDTFAADGAKMLKPHAQLFLDLKTQAYISAVTNDKAAIINGQRSRGEILDALFPAELGKLLLGRRSGAAQPTPTEREFVDRARDRREALFEESYSEEAIDALPQKYSWEDFLRDVHSYINGNFENITGNTTSKAPRRGRLSNPGRVNQQSQAQTTLHTPQGNQGQQPQGFGGLSDTPIQSTPNTTNNIAEKAARAAHFAMENFGANAQHNLAIQPLPQTPQNPTPSQQQDQTAQASGPPIQFHFERPLHPNIPSPPAPFFTQIPYQNGQMQGQWHPGSGGNGQFHQSYDAQGMIPYPTQSAPTHVLYERARQAASTKPSQQQTPRKTPTNTPTQRRPWTSDEENALMAGLDRVKGPHWSQIHAMFGPGGTINDVLKDRTQVQLKDKARNLKLFFLKSNIEVPYYLQFVTGELKTRAPSRVARNEAQEKGMSEEDRAHVQGVMTLAGTVANAMQEGEQSAANIGLEHAQGEPDQNGSGLGAAPSGNDVNIDPALEAQLQNATVEGHMAPNFSGRYTVPTPNMLMQTLDKLSAGEDPGQQLQR